MRCLGCKAWKDGKCLAGVTPYRSKNERDGTGCACNTRTVEKLLRQNRKTNADRIRSMTDEELAEFIAYSTSCETCVVRKGGSYECHNTNCSTAWLDWLKEEAET